MALDEAEAQLGLVSVLSPVREKETKDIRPRRQPLLPSRNKRILELSSIHKALPHSDSVGIFLAVSQHSFLILKEGRKKK